MKEDRIVFYSGPGLQLVGMLSRPGGGESSSTTPGIVLCQGPITGKSPDGLARDGLGISIGERLAAAGFATLRFCYRGVGESDGPEYRIIPMEQVEDIGNAVTFLQQQPGIDPDRIGLVGAATGGAHATYVAGTDERIKCMVSINGMGDLGRWMRDIRRYWEWLDFSRMIAEDTVQRILTGESRLVEIKDVIVHDPETARHAAQGIQEGRLTAKRWISLESAGAIAAYAPEDVADRIAPRAALWVCAQGDTLVPNDQSQSMYDNAREPKRIVVLDDVTHHGLYHGDGFERMMNPVIEWFHYHL